MEQAQWAFISGSGQRLGASMARHLHGLGYNIALHYRHSIEPAQRLANELNQCRSNSVQLFGADLTDAKQLAGLIDAIQRQQLPLNVLINNASEFFPTDWQDISIEKFQQLIQVNLVAPCLLIQGLFTQLAANQGCVINMIDIHGQRPLKHHGLYSVTKAGLQMATLSMAQEFAPAIRVNGIAPGAILWPEQSQSTSQQQVLAEIPMGRAGSLDDINKTLQFLVESAYINGQIIAVDGGRSATGYRGA
ncbi:SDR family oxidoreductase [Shewanella sp. NIFS-20-20]|uniref:SDR family oxidoreductase n=1 Tax=Shewanella sp. NIFS-20-20 TaxID=2853806 RepID=UPI001C4492FC|nr:SDR family oxidoreductase [Shewanella sp. NIFS-20-20]MBV7316875.1 SDR family oxidoreductase [Shewanella sp. NIFS-20-20]